MQKINFYSCLLFVLLTVNIGYAQGNRLQFKNLSLDDGLSQSFVGSIAQDEKGFLWFGTQDGLNKFDGFSFSTFGKTLFDKKMFGWVNDICAYKNDTSNFLWVGTNFGLMLIDLKKSSYEFIGADSTENSLTNQSIVDLHLDKSNNLWIATNGGGLNKYDIKKKKFYSFRADKIEPYSISNDFLVSIFEDSQGDIWVGATSGCLNKYNAQIEGFTKYQIVSEVLGKFYNNNINSIIENSDGNLWLGTDKGLYLFDKAKGKTINHDLIDNYQKVSKFPIRALYIDKNQNIWIGTDNDGLKIYNLNSQSYSEYYTDPSNPHSISDNVITKIFEDNSGVIWIGTWTNGIDYFYDDRKFRAIGSNFDHNLNFTDDCVYSIYKDSDEVLWLGSLGGLNRIDLKNKSIFDKNLDVSYYFKDSRILWIHEPKSEYTKVLWFGTNAGLYKYTKSNKSWKVYRSDINDKNSITHNKIYTILEDSEGILWVGTDGGGLNRKISGTDKFINYMDTDSSDRGVKGNRTFIIFEDSEKELWVGTDKGAFTYNRREDRFQKFSLGDDERLEKFGENIFNLYEDSKHRIWINVLGDGFRIYDRKANTIKHFDATSGLADNTAYAFLEDEEGFVWITTNKGMSKFDPQALTFRNYGPNDGLQSNEFNLANFHDSDGTMYLAGVKGLNVFHPKDITDDTSLPTVVLTKFNIFNKSINVDEKVNERIILNKSIEYSEIIELTHKDYVFSFEYGATNYSAPGECNYAYKMEGFEKDWNYVEDRRFATYTNLPPGDYTFRVKASNKDGYWNEEGVSVSITISPPFYKSTWFLLIIVSIIILLVWLFINYRTKRINGVNKNLESKVTERTEELEKYAFHSSLISMIGQELSSHLNLDKLLPEITSTIQTALEYNYVSLYLFEKDSSILILKAFSGNINISAKKTSVQLGEGLVGLACKNGEHQLSNDVDNDERFVRYSEEQTKAELSVPIKLGNHSIGVIDLQSEKPNSFNEFDVSTIEALSIHIASAINNANLFNKAQAEIKERMEIQKTLKESEEKYRYLVENINDVIFSVIEKGIITYISPAIKTILGFNPHALVNKKLIDFVYSKDKEKFNNRFEKYSEDTAIMGEYRMYCKNDEIRWMRISERPTIIAGEIESSQGVITDITELKKLETQLVQSQKLESIGHLAAGIAHEINTPIQFIGDNSNFLLDAFSEISIIQKENQHLVNSIQNGENFQDIIVSIKEKVANADLDYLMDEIPEAIKGVLEGVSRVSTIVNAMKNFSHPGEEKKSNLDINNLIQSTIIVSRNEWKYSAELLENLDKSIPPIACLPGQFNQVILNILVNASHTISDEINSGRYDMGKIEISSKVKDEFVSIIIKDNGKGIPMEIKNKVFDPFFTTKEVGKGTGQGLSIAHDIIVNRHGGNLDFTSEIGVGTTFMIELPLQTV